MASVFVACTSGSKLFVSEVNNAATATDTGDSVLISLRQKNDLVIAFATENYAWVRNISYLLICKNDNTWYGYNYKKQNMPNDKSYSFSEIKINAPACDSLLNFINKNKAWEITGDTEEKSRCGESNSNCNINDASSNSLWLFTKEKLVSSSYYAPAFYEACCPGNVDRKLFLTIGAMVYSITSANEEQRAN